MGLQSNDGSLKIIALILWLVIIPRCWLTGDGPVYRDVLIECNVIPALLARITPDTPVRKGFHIVQHIKILYFMSLTLPALQN